MIQGKERLAMVLWILHLAYDIKRAGQWFKFRNGLLVRPGHRQALKANILVRYHQD